MLIITIEFRDCRLNKSGIGMLCHDHRGETSTGRKMAKKMVKK
jgi:hypothetical protein